MDTARAIWLVARAAIQEWLNARRAGDRRFVAHERRVSAETARPTLITLAGASVLSLVAGGATQGTTSLVTLITVFQVALGAAGAILVPRTRIRHRALLMFGALLVAVQGPVLTIVTVRDLDVSTLAYLVLIPVGVAVFVPWSTRVHALWLAGFGLCSVELVLLLGQVPGGRLSTRDVIGPIVVAMVLSVGGHVAGRTRRRVSFERLDESRRLRRKLGRENRSIRTSSEQSARDARTDALTGVANRLSLESDIAAHEFGATRCAVLMIDVDHFKAINDRLGHPAGDAALRRIANAIRSQIRPGDQVYRYGGEEFLVRLEGTGGAVAVDVAERVRRAIAALRIANPGARPPVLTASVGLAIVGADGPLPAIARADVALYAAKRSGRNRVTVAAPAAVGEPLAELSATA